MKVVRNLAFTLGACALLALGACGDKNPSNDTSDTTRAHTDTAAGTMGNAGQTISDETIEKKVESALIAEPGFGGVDVESQPDGMIVLTGTVASENEKARAQVIAQNVDGVKGVTNNVTVSAAK